MSSTSVNKNESLSVDNKTEDKAVIPKLAINSSTTSEPTKEVQKTNITAKVKKAKEPIVKTEKTKRESERKTTTTRKKSNTDDNGNTRKTSTKPPTTSKSANVKTSLVLQYQSLEVDTETLIKKVKDFWTNAQERSEEDIKSLDLYIKPEEYSAYYVINGSEKGRVDF